MSVQVIVAVPVVQVWAPFKVAFDPLTENSNRHEPTTMTSSWSTVTSSTPPEPLDWKRRSKLVVDAFVIGTPLQTLVALSIVDCQTPTRPS